ncbi:late embryogenesis abundant domain-containing family protein [Cucumis melo var. makuwa]|nr:late embryogenesis abundant domain-containing family protein [Cucumis melo var. makuwa]
MAGKAKQTVEDAWGSVKDTTQNIKEKVVGKAEESKEAIKDTAENIKNNIKSNC